MLILYNNSALMITRARLAGNTNSVRFRHSRAKKKVYDNLEEHKTGITRHFPPANKEWKDSVFSYNKNYLRTVPFKYNQANDLIKAHFNIHSRRFIARSKRMRSKLIRYSSTKIYVSRPEIKQNNDKVIITVYIFDRERQFFIRKLFFLERKPAAYNSWLISDFNKKLKMSKGKLRMSRNIIRTSYLKSRRKSMFKLKVRRKPVRGKVPMYGIKLNNQLDFLRYKLLNLSKRFFLLDKLLLYLFICYFLSLFNIKVLKQSDLNHDNLSKIIENKPETLLILNNEDNKLNVIGRDNITNSLVDSLNSGNEVNNTTDQQLSINKLWEFIQSNFVSKGIIPQTDLNRLYKTFVRFNYNKIMYNLYKSEARMFYNYTRMEMNKMKFTKLIPIFKSLMSRIYNKTTELNIVNLKYIHLNGDLFTQAIASKLRKKIGLLKVLRKSFRLVKMPLKFNFMKLNVKLSNFNKFDNLSVKNLPFNSSLESESNLSKDKLDVIMNKMLLDGREENKKSLFNLFPIIPRRVKNNSRVNKILTDIKFKWVSGLRLEVAGRLTRRNTASRSVFKFKYKGNLRNKQHYMGNGLLRVMSVVMLRNNGNVNTQYTFTKSKRRIGSFGLKSWISGY